MNLDHRDWIGTERAWSNLQGNEAKMYSLPFGDGYSNTGSDPQPYRNPYHFAGLDQDTTADEHAQFREYSNMAGRWFSPDPYQGSYNPNNPSPSTATPTSSTTPSASSIRVGLCPPRGRNGWKPPCGGGGGSGGPCESEFYGTYYPGENGDDGGYGFPWFCNQGGTTQPGSGESGPGNNAPSKNVFGVTPKQKQDCLNAWSNSGLGKSVQFFSLYNLATNFKNAWKEWTIVPVAKGLFVGALERASNALEGGEVVSVTTGTVETLSGPAASGLGSAVSAGAAAAPYGIGAATILDMNASAGCMGMQSNYFESGQVGVF